MLWSYQVENENWKYWKKLKLNKWIFALGSIKAYRLEQPAEAILQNISIHKYLTCSGKAAVINFENDLQYHSFEPGAQ